MNSVGLNGKMHSSHNSSLCCQEIASNVAGIVEDSRKKALKLVDTAIKVWIGPEIAVSLMCYFTPYC